MAEGEGGGGFLPSLSPLEWGGCWRSSASLSQCELPIWQSWEFPLERPLLHSAGSNEGSRVRWASGDTRTLASNPTVVAPGRGVWDGRNQAVRSSALARSEVKELCRRNIENVPCGINCRKKTFAASLIECLSPTVVYGGW